MNRIHIGQNKYVGKDDPCLIMLDAGVNHNNNPDRALELVKATAKTGADVVKFQTYKASAITTKKAPRYWNPKLDTDSGGTQYDTFARIDDLPLEAYADMKVLAEELGIVFSSTPFNLDDVYFLAELGMDVFKISSSDLVYHDLIRETAKTGMPVILSTGLASIREMEEAVEVILKENNSDIILQHCILSYPCEDEDANLVKMKEMQTIFSDIPIGYSDHTYGDAIPTAAVAMGAKTIEKHFTLDKSLPDSPDHGFALDTEETKHMVDRIRRTEKGFGIFVDGYYKAEEKAYSFARKSLTSRVSISKGEVITREMLTAKRPGTGIPPNQINEIAGMKAIIDIEEDETIMMDMIS
ncbi:N-acetylneuraminate synthase family protein [Gammaproteobacteria bacterium]|nr:N-acetylneuraminate synthase family protein [Gammaproteobacteria bacterium]